MYYGIPLGYTIELELVIICIPSNKRIVNGLVGIKINRNHIYNFWYKINKNFNNKNMFTYF